MPSVEALNVRSEWVGHEFRVLARRHGWLIKKVGVESIFAKRKGVLAYLQYRFTPISLLLRSQPDMLLRGDDCLEMVEAKAVEDPYANVSIEAWQFAYLYALCSEFGVATYYVFGQPENDTFTAVMAPVDSLPLTCFFRPPRFRQWDTPLRQSLDNYIDRHCPGIAIHDLPQGHRGSGDPYLVFPKSSLSRFKTVFTWLGERGNQCPTNADRISWEGRDQASQQWRSYKWSEWERIYKRGAQVPAQIMPTGTSGLRP